MVNGNDVRFYSMDEDGRPCRKLDSTIAVLSPVYDDQCLELTTTDCCRIYVKTIEEMK